jgi:regulator of protease activity HflC (stomatin/prohibitin superfamily)
MKQLLITTLLLSGVVTGLFLAFGTIVPVGYFGVPQILIGPGQGVAERGGGPGVYLSIPFYRKVHVIPETLKATDFNRVKNEALEITAAEGVVLDIDLTVLTRFVREASKIDDIEFAGPNRLLQTLTSEPRNWEERIRKVVQSNLIKEFGGLRPAQFYDVAIRDAALLRGEKKIRQDLAPHGIYVEAVLLRRYTYRDDRIDEAIFNKNLQEQEQRLKDTASGLADVKAQLEAVDAEWDAKTRTLRIQGENEAKVIRSEASRIEAEKMAEGDLLVAKAQAEVDRAKASVLSVGGGNFVAREFAPFIESLRGGVVREINPYDLNAWLSKLGGEKR